MESLARAIMNQGNVASKGRLPAAGGFSALSMITSEAGDFRDGLVDASRQQPSVTFLNSGCRSADQAFATRAPIAPTGKAPADALLKDPDPEIDERELPDSVQRMAGSCLRHRALSVIRRQPPTYPASVRALRTRHTP